MNPALGGNPALCGGSPALGGGKPALGGGDMYPGCGITPGVVG